MDFLNRAYGQLVELFRSMSPGARLTTGMLLAVLITSLTFLFRQKTDNANEYLFGGEVLTQSDIAALEFAFSKGGLNGWTAEGNRVRVPRSQKHTYLAAAAKESATPESFRRSSDDMLASNSAFDPKDVRQKRETNAREKDLVQTLRKMPDIEDARVTLSETKIDGFPPKVQRRAMVGVQAFGSKLLDEKLIQTIRYTVAAGGGLDAADVTVTDLNGSLAYPGTGKDGMPTAFENIPATYQRQYEGQYKRLISEALSMIPGVTVAVHVELDKELNNTTKSLKYDDKPTSIKQNTHTKETSNAADRTAGRPGAASNGVGPNSPAQVAGSSAGESTSTESREDQESLAGATEVTTQRPGLMPTKVTATIGVPSSYFLKIWRQQHPAAKGETPKDPTAEELTRIQEQTESTIKQSVANLLPPQPKGETTLDLVKVMPYVEMPEYLPESPGIMDLTGVWLADNWQTLGLFALAGFGVLFLRNMIRSAQSAAAVASSAAHPRESAAAMEGAEPLGDTDENQPFDVAGALKKKFQTSGRSLREELSDLVKGDPDAAANIVKLWISDAA